MVNKDILEKYIKEVKEQNKQVAKVVKELDGYIFDFLKMALQYVFTLYENKGVNFSIEPCGDYYNNTYHLSLSPISYLVVYHVKKQDIQNYLNNKVLKEKYTSKYLKKFIGDVAAPMNVPTNEDIANMIYKFIDRLIDLKNRSFCKYGTIRYSFDNAYQVKIAVAYKYEDGNYVFTDNNKFIEIDFNKVQENIKKKEKETKKNYSKVCSLFKAFETEMLCSNKIEDILHYKNYFVEELLYNVPNELFLEKDITIKCENIIKYLKKMNLYKLKMLNDKPLNDKARITFYRIFIKRLSMFNNLGTSILLNIFN